MRGRAEFAGTLASEGSQPVSAPRRPTAGSLPRELRSLPTLAVLAFVLLVAMPVTILLTPLQALTVAGQHVAVGARAPSLTLSGPAQLVQVGNTELDVPLLEIYGPLRPKLVMGPVQRNTDAAAVLDAATSGAAQADARNAITDAFVRWYLLGGLVLLACTLAGIALIGCARLLVMLRRETAAHHRQVSVADVWQRSSSAISRMTVVGVVAALLAWAGSGWLAYSGSTNGLAAVGSLSDLVGAHQSSPEPVGPVVQGFTGAVIGDSRASRVGGPPPLDAGPDDLACGRSADSLADEIGALLPTRVLNLGCAGASVTSGLRGEQLAGDRLMPPQVGRLKQVEGLRFVVVMIGPNDVNWADFLRYCYAADDCSDNFSQGEFGYRLAEFDREYGYLLQDLNDLPGQPEIIVVTSYPVFEPTAACADARGPAEAKGQNPAKIELLNGRNEALNAILVGGAQKYGFPVARPRLTPLCAPTHDQLGADLQGLADREPFHPTAVGVLRTASVVTRLIPLEATR